MSDYLPQDLLIDILTRLPAESLVRLTPVCKSWHSLITGPKFISRHLHRTASNPDNDRLLVSYRTDEPKQNQYSLVVDGKDSFRQLKTLDLPVGAFESLGYSVVGSCNGVICLSDDQEYGYMDDMFLWNPSIRKFFAIPRYNVTFQSHCPFMHCVGFGYDPVTDDFKVVRVVHTGGDCDRILPEVEIYSLKTGRWRYISDKALPVKIRERYRQAYFNGAAHWMAFTRGPIHHTILASNRSEELFNEILVPESLTHVVSRYRMVILVVFKESLCLIQCVYGNDPHCSIWSMKEYGVATSWANLFRINLCGGLSTPLGLRKNGEVIFATSDGNLVSCDHQSQSITYFGIHGKFGNELSHTFYPDTYTESLELLNRLESPENEVISGQKEEEKEEQGGGGVEEKQKEAGSR
ncbi:hypothetical protein RHMOL_Rhmol06G0178800 [Rhododendron molle]|uniref:Uncharacterized protein n=1 Tax=Rhododendron molle TaxID=49168 RepID=A0ACC0NDL8_RHOML|nr:hypothetical protein RHMOL_Rhmol06G0178800 [Rhododendron molle]